MEQPGFGSQHTLKLWQVLRLMLQGMNCTFKLHQQLSLENIENVKIWYYALCSSVSEFKS